MTTTSQEFDIVVWGATGFVGQLVAEHLTRAYTAAGVTVALGGRDEVALDRLADRLTGQHDGWDELPIVLGDATDETSLYELAERTQVVATTVGPYTEYGRSLVAACIDAETDYCDLTGGITWDGQMIDR